MSVWHRLWPFSACLYLHFAQAFLTSIGVGNGYWLGGEKLKSGWTDPNNTVIETIKDRPPLEFGDAGLCQMMGLKGGVLLPDDWNCDEKDLVKVFAQQYDHSGNANNMIMIY